MDTHKEQEQDKDKEKDKDKEGGSGGKPKRFTPPTVEAVAAYCLERSNHVDARQFVDFYTGKGWMIGKNKMTDWMATVRTWERNGGDTRAGPGDPRGTKSVVAEFIARGKTDGKS